MRRSDGRAPEFQSPPFAPQTDCRHPTPPFEIAVIVLDGKVVEGDSFRMIISRLGDDWSRLAYAFLLQTEKLF